MAWFSWRARRQLAAIAVVSAAAGIVLFFFGSRLIPAPGCFDNRRNQGEIQVDCGGPRCGSCELKNAKPLGVFWARATRAAPELYDASALVENPNETLSSARLEYVFTFFDDTGIVAQRTGATFFYPQERLVIVEPGLRAARDPLRVEFQVSGVSWRSGGETPPRVIVEERSYRIADEGGKKKSIVEASLFNESPFDFRAMETTVALFDEGGNLMGANKTTSGDFRSRSRARARFVWPEALGESVARIEIYPRVNIFDPAAMVRP